MRRSTVLSPPRQLVFPAGNINQPSELNTFLLILGIGKFVEKNVADADADADACVIRRHSNNEVHLRDRW
jgi:hypothetical protein